MKAARAFHIAGNIGDDLIVAGQRLIKPPQPDRGALIQPQPVTADAIMADIHLVVEHIREAVTLPIGGHMALIHSAQVDPRDHIAGAVEKGRLRIGRRFGVKAHQTAVHIVVIFKEANHRHIRPQILEERHLAPAGVTQNNIGFKAGLALKLLQRLHRTKARACGRFPVL
ncbi:hypothetical protein TRM7557_03061 [Tritonibacter multivorans]|uniref:Uncharacterized protein n=1 Tax=Tritonibacter multivorans TaxID=928856 RepID=A0A0N7M0L0_9RHOB|nr:hypothetical protein TRM7557_03061 [Tritonibacter multivorans]